MLTIKPVVTWTALQPVRLAVLDRRITAVMGRWPELVSAIVARAVRRSFELATNQATSHLTRVDARLELLFWGLADRWGRVGPDGVVLELPLTHQVLGRLVGAQRPSVTTALSDLARRGVIERRDDGAWMLRGDPPGDPAGDAGVAAQADADAESARRFRRSSARARCRARAAAPARGGPARPPTRAPGRRGRRSPARSGDRTGTCRGRSPSGETARGLPLDSHCAIRARSGRDARRIARRRVRTSARPMPSAWAVCGPTTPSTAAPCAPGSGARRAPSAGRRRRRPGCRAAAAAATTTGPRLPRSSTSASALAGAASTQQARARARARERGRGGGHGTSVGSFGRLRGELSGSRGKIALRRQSPREGVPAAIRPVDRDASRSEWVPRSPSSGTTETRLVGLSCPQGKQIGTTDASRRGRGARPAAY